MADLFHELALFSWSVVLHWGALLTGGAVMAVVGVYEHKKGKELSWTSYFLIFIVFGFYSVFASWQDKYHEVQDARHELASLEKPEFELNPPNFSIGKMDFLERQNATSVITFITVFNHGTPSVIKDWSLAVIRQNGTKVYGIASLQGTTVIGKNGSPSPLGLTLSADQSLLKTATRIPIPTGGEAGGFINFIFTSISTDDIRLPGTQFDLILKDITGKAYEWKGLSKPSPNADLNLLPVPPDVVR